MSDLRMILRKNDDSGENKPLKRIRSTEDFVRWSKLIHGENTFKYDLAKYVDRKTKIKLICSLKHEFDASFIHHLNKKTGCTKCAALNTGKKLMEKAEKRFVENAQRIHGNLYDYSQVDYKGSHIHVKIVCRKYNHEFNIQPNVHLSVGQGCKFCNEELIKEGEQILNVKTAPLSIKWTTNKFIEEAKKVHGDKYIYDKTIFRTDR